MPVDQEPQHPIIGVLPRIFDFQIVNLKKLLLSARLSKINGGSTTWRVMYGNGAMIDMQNIRRELYLTHMDLRWVTKEEL